MKEISFTGIYIIYQRVLGKMESKDGHLPRNYIHCS